MGLPSVDDAVTYLYKRGLWVNVSNPGNVMPHLNGPVVAVGLHEATMTERTFVAYICGPQNAGRSSCEQMAYRVAQYWTQMNGVCKWGYHSFDSKSAMHTMKVYGTWTEPEEETPAE